MTNPSSLTHYFTALEFTDKVIRWFHTLLWSLLPRLYLLMLVRLLLTGCGWARMEMNDFVPYACVCAVCDPLQLQVLTACCMGLPPLISDTWMWGLPCA